jgi:hypothetical protein
MTIAQWIAMGVSVIVYGSLLALAAWAVHTRGKLAGAARAWRDVAMRAPREPALTVVAPEYHSPRAERVAPWGSS